MEVWYDPGLIRDVMVFNSVEIVGQWCFSVVCTVSPNGFPLWKIMISGTNFEQIILTLLKKRQAENANHSILFIFQEKHGEFNLVLKTIGRDGDGEEKRRRKRSLKSYEQHHQLLTIYV